MKNLNPGKRYLEKFLTLQFLDYHANSELKLILAYKIVISLEIFKTLMRIVDNKKKNNF